MAATEVAAIIILLIVFIGTVVLIKLLKYISAGLTGLRRMGKGGEKTQEDTPRENDERMDYREPSSREPAPTTGRLPIPPPAENGTDSLETITCPHCNRTTAATDFCGWCGGKLR